MKCASVREVAAAVVASAGLGAAVVIGLPALVVASAALLLAELISPTASPRAEAEAALDAAAAVLNARGWRGRRWSRRGVRLVDDAGEVGAIDLPEALALAGRLDERGAS